MGRFRCSLGELTSTPSVPLFLWDLVDLRGMYRLAKSPSLLFSHFFAVAFYSIYCLFTRPRLVPSSPSPSSSSSPASSHRPAQQKLVTPTLLSYPSLLFKSIRVFLTAVFVFGPLLWAELRWWAPNDTKRRNTIFVYAFLPIVLALAFGWGVWVRTLSMQEEYFGVGGLVGGGGVGGAGAGVLGASSAGATVVRGAVVRGTQVVKGVLGMGGSEL